MLCPRCPDDYCWLLRGNSWEEKGGKWMTDSRDFPFWVAPAAEEMADALVGLLSDVVWRFPVDPCRIFLSGCSMGGHACLDLAARFPDLFCAVAPVAAHVQAECASRITEQLQGIPLWAFHGVDDFCCPYDDIVVLTRKLGGSAWLTSYWQRHEELSIHNSASQVAYVHYGRALFSWMLRQPPRSQDLVHLVLSHSRGAHTNDSDQVPLLSSHRKV